MKYSELTATHKLYLQIKSIKQAQWLFTIIVVVGGSTAITLAIFAGLKINNQFDILSRSVGASAMSQMQLENKILDSLLSKEDTEFKMMYITKRMNHVILKVNTITANSSFNFDKNFLVPGCKDYEDHIMTLMRTPRRPIMHNLYLFTGGHGLGKTYASYILARAMSRFDNVVLITVPMFTYIQAASELNVVCDILHGVDARLAASSLTYTIIWMFDELDTYILNLREVYDTKDISEFAEMCDFTNDKKRILTFAMNNGEILKHNYWDDADVIAHNLTEYEHHDDLLKAIKLTHTNIVNFMKEGQLSRLASFIGRNIYNYRPFDRATAEKFIKGYLLERYDLLNQTVLDNVIFKSKNNRYSMRELLMRTDDLLNIIPA